MLAFKKFLSLFKRQRLPEYEPTYRRGDHVQAIYGGPVMTVSDDKLLLVGGKVGVPRVWVVWYDKDMVIHKARFQHSELKRVK